MAKYRSILQPHTDSILLLRQGPQPVSYVEIAAMMQRDHGIKVTARSVYSFCLRRYEDPDVTEQLTPYLKWFEQLFSTSHAPTPPVVANLLQEKHSVTISEGDVYRFLRQKGFYL